jgi:DNA-binding transcriptional ArsR family regulator
VLRARKAAASASHKARRRRGDLSPFVAPCDIAMQHTALSRHLRTLKASGLIEEAHPEFDARVRIYTLRPKPMTGLKAWLEQTERLWIEQLAAFKAHLERPR